MATATFKQCIALSKDFSPALLSLGDCALASGLTQAALGYYTHFVKDFIKFGEISGTVYSKHSSEDVLSAAVWKRGYCHFELGDVDLSRLDFETCARLDRAESAIAYHYLAKCSMKQGLFEKAIEENTKAIERKNDLVGAFRDRAHAYEMAGNNYAAESDKRTFVFLMSKLAADNKLHKKDKES